MLTRRLASANCSLSTHELRSTVGSLEAERTTLLDRLTWVSVQDFTSLVPEQRADVNRQWSIWSRKAAARKAIALELWRIVTELLPEGTSRNALWVRHSSQTRTQLLDILFAKLFLGRASIDRRLMVPHWPDLYISSVHPQLGRLKGNIIE